MRCVILLLFLSGTGIAQSKNPAALLEKAGEAALAGRYETADSILRKIVKESPGSGEAEIARARLDPNALLRTIELEINGDPENRIDVFILGDGYSREKKFQKLFDRGARETLKYFDQAPVFHRYRKYFNFHAMNIASNEDGVDTEDRDYDTALGAYQSDGTQKQVAVDHQRVAHYLKQSPASEGFAVVIVRLGSLGTGGGGIAVVGGVPSNTVIHEWGHAFGNLLDEYTSDVGYTGPAPRGYNVSNSPDEYDAPWKHWLDVKKKGVGMFAGGAGRSIGAWRATASGCAMSSGPSYCLVCREAVTAHIYDVVSPIDSVFPEDGDIVLQQGEEKAFEVIPLEVTTAPTLRVLFSLEVDQGSPVARNDDPFSKSSAYRDEGNDWDPFSEMPDWGADGGGLFMDGWVSWSRPSRLGKQPESPLSGQDLPARKGKTEDRKTCYRTTLRTEDIGPGKYLLHCRVFDPTDWVLKAAWKPLLSETHTWRITVQ